jgi:hypothetical protein
MLTASFGNHASCKIVAPVASGGRSLMKKLASRDAYQLGKILTAVLSRRPLDESKSAAGIAMAISDKSRAPFESDCPAPSLDIRTGPCRFRFVEKGCSGQRLKGPTRARLS